MGFSCLLSRSALVAFAVVVSSLVSSGNSKPTACSAGAGNSDAIIALQNRVHLELGQDMDDAKGGAHSVNNKGGADGQEDESQPMKAVEDHAERTSSGPQQEKAAELVDEEEVMFLESKKVLFEEGESEVVAGDIADDNVLPSSNAAPSSVTEDRSSGNATVAAGFDTSAEKKGNVTDTGTHRAEASSSAVSENKTFNNTGTVENSQSNTFSPNASGEDVMLQEELDGLVHHANSFSQTIRQMVAVKLQALGARENPALAIVLVVLILMCTCLGCLFIGWSSEIPFLGESRSSTTARTIPVMEQRQAMMERWPPSFRDQPVPPTSGSILPAWPHRENSGGILPSWPGQADQAAGYYSGQLSRQSLPPSSQPSLQNSSQIILSRPTSEASVGAVSMSRPMSQVVMTRPLSMATAQDAPAWVKLTHPASVSELDITRDLRAVLHPQLHKPEEVPLDVLPPPLCPGLVIPTGKARFGVPMFELAEVNGEGEVGIVGLSGAPLLRGIVRTIGTKRSLEIAMNEANTAPRATVTPSMMELAGHSQQSGGAKVLEIRGVRGAFYGTLEMRAHMDGGTCCVVKDGEVVLRVEGNAESLCLQIKSGNGAELASVWCSSEAFGGIDHIEICVQKGVDTVLVLAVVLTVLLLNM